TLQPALEALPALEAHHHVRGGVGLEHTGHAYDARVLEASQRARLLEEALPPPLDRLLVALRLRPHAEPRVAVAELVGIVFLQRHPRAERDVLGLARCASHSLSP